MQCERAAIAMHPYRINIDQGNPSARWGEGVVLPAKDEEAMCTVPTSPRPKDLFLERYVRR